MTHAPGCPVANAGLSAAMILNKQEPRCTCGAADVARSVRAFAQAILHGDEEHRAWLLRAGEEFIRSGTVPPCRPNAESATGSADVSP